MSVLFLSDGSSGALMNANLSNELNYYDGSRQSLGFLACCILNSNDQLNEDWLHNSRGYSCYSLLFTVDYILN